MLNCNGGWEINLVAGHMTILDKFWGPILGKKGEWIVLGHQSAFRRMTTMENEEAESQLVICKNNSPSHSLSNTLSIPSKTERKCSHCG